MKVALMKNSKIGKRAKAMIKTDTDILSGGSYAKDLKTETAHISGYRVGTKNIPALFWSVTLSNNGKKETKVKKEIGNE